MGIFTELIPWPRSGLALTGCLAVLAFPLSAEVSTFAGSDQPVTSHLLVREANLMRNLQAPGHPQALEAELATVRYQLALAEIFNGNDEVAFAYLQSSVQLDDRNAGRLERLADLLDDLPQPSAPYLAQSYYEDALERDPARRDCRAKLAASYLATGDFTDARHHLEILCRNDGGHPDARFVQDLSLCYLSLDEVFAGADFFATMVEAGGGPPFVVALAIFLNQMGMTADAAAFAGHAAQVADDPEFSAYAAALAKKYAKGGRP